MAVTPASQVPTTPASTCPCLPPGRASAPESISGCEPRFRISDRAWRPISAHLSLTEPVSYPNYYEKTCHGGQLEDVQDPRRNHPVLREVPAAGRNLGTR